MAYYIFLERHNFVLIKKSHTFAQITDIVFVGKQIQIT